MYEYKAKLVRVIDGDTVELDLDLGFRTHLIERVRVRGVDTPELLSSDQAQRVKAHAAKGFVEAQLAGSVIVVQTEKPDPRDKYGRYLAAIRYRLTSQDQWKDLTTRLIEEGHGVAYDGGKR